MTQNRNLTFKKIGDCWKCEHLRAERIDFGWLCDKSHTMFGNPKIGTDDQCPNFLSESGTDVAEFLSK